MALRILIFAVLAGCSTAPKELPEVYVHDARSESFIRLSDPSLSYGYSDPASNGMACVSAQEAPKIAAKLLACDAAFKPFITNIQPKP